MSELQIPIAKGGKGCVFTISDVDEWFGGLSPETQLDIIARGAKDALNSRMTKPTEGLGASTQLEKAGDTAGLSKLREAALEQAQKNFDDLTAGKLVKKTAKSSEKREVITRAVAMAREIVRNEMRKNGIKFSQVKASVVTAAATKLVEADPRYIEQAKAAIEAAKTVEATIDVASLISVDPELVAKAAQKNAERKAETSAKQAGMPKGKGKGKVPPRRPEATPQHVH